MWQRLMRELQQELSPGKRDRSRPDFDEEANALAIGVIVLGLLIGGFFLLRSLIREKPVNPAYTQLEAIKRVENLVLVRQHYESLIPVTRKGKADDLRFLLRAPVEIDGYLDLSQVVFDLQPDSLVVVYMPAAEVDTPYLDLEHTQVYAPGQALIDAMREGLTSERTSYLDAYDQIRGSLAEARYHVRQRAYANGILQQTQREGQRYLRNLLNSLGYRARFETPLDFPPGTSDSTRLEMIWQRLQQAERTLPRASEAERRSVLSNLGRLLR